MKTTIIALISATLGAVLFASCCQPKPHSFDDGGIRIVKPDLSREENQLRALAVTLGASQRAAANMDLAELISEIRSRVAQNERRVPADTNFSDAELSELVLPLEGYEEEYEKIKKNAAFLKSLRGKRILVLPDESSSDERSRF